MTRSKSQLVSRCTLCPAGCQIRVVRSGPDTWQADPPEKTELGLCPRGSCLGELLGHRLRIRFPARRVDGKLQPCSQADAARAILAAAGQGPILLLLDGNSPCEDLAAAAAWCNAWEQAQLCLVVEPADRQLLLGTEASGADYLSAEELSQCDGFVIVGDAFAANPTCSRGLLDRRRSQPRTPIVVIDPAAGVASKFATHSVDCRPGMELSALQAVAAGAGVQIEAEPARPPTEMPSALAAGKALSQCKRLAVLVSAEHGRSVAWQQRGETAGRLAKALGGGVAVQTVGANALAAVRLEGNLQTMPLAEALSGAHAVRVAVGCDVLGMLGTDEPSILAAAAPLPNRTTEAAQVVLPVAMPGELGGTFLFDGGQAARIDPLMAAPAGVPSPAELIAALARAAGVAATVPAEADAAALERLSPRKPATPPPPPEANGPLLLLGKHAMHSGCGSLTAAASWQASVQSAPELRMAAPDAGGMGLENLSWVTVRSGDRSVRARLRIAPELPDGVLVLSDGFPQSRAMIPCRIDAEAGAVAAEPVTVTVSAD